MDTALALLAATLNAGTPLLLAAMGVLIVERSGVVNLGVEGMMLVGAVCAFAAAKLTGSALLGFGAGCAVGVLLSLLFAWFTLVLNANPYATGLALALFGTGVSAFIGLPFAGENLQLGARWSWLGLHPLVYLSFLMVPAAGWFLFRTRAGLVLRAVGESPESAHALGHPVRLVRGAALMFGGACAGLAGAYLSVVYTPLWAEGMVAGRGWIALALVVFATWRPWRVAIGAYLFGGMTMVQLYLQGQGVAVASEWLSMAPYLATVVVLAAISRDKVFLRLNMPASLGKVFRPGA
jgi:simple sugar transport system permease protein